MRLFSHSEYGVNVDFLSCRTSYHLSCYQENEELYLMTSASLCSSNETLRELSVADNGKKQCKQLIDIQEDQSFNAQKKPKFQLQGCGSLGTAVQCKISVLNIIPWSNANNKMLTVHTTYYINLSQHEVFSQSSIKHHLSVNETFIKQRDTCKLISKSMILILYVLQTPYTVHSLVFQ